MRFPLADETAGGKKGEEGEGEEGGKWYHAKHGFRYLLALDGILDKRTKGLDLFPSMLEGEFHGARSTIERFSNMGSKEVLEGGGFVGGVGVSRSLGEECEGEGEAFG